MFFQPAHVTSGEKKNIYISELQQISSILSVTPLPTLEGTDL
jgi:hypothetical protein